MTNTDKNPYSFYNYNRLVLERFFNKFPNEVMCSCLIDNQHTPKIEYFLKDVDVCEKQLKKIKGYIYIILLCDKDFATDGYYKALFPRFALFNDDRDYFKQLGVEDENEQIMLEYVREQYL